MSDNTTRFVLIRRIRNLIRRWAVHLGSRLLVASGNVPGIDMSIRYHFSCDDVSSGDLESLFAAAKLGGRVGDKLRRAFQNSHAVCLAYEGDRLIGASRAITDGEYHGVIYDVAVWPEYQGRGIGAQMLQELLARLPVWRVMLVADSDVQGFYRKAGFDEYPNVMARLDASRLYDVAPSKS